MEVNRCQVTAAAHCYVHWGECHTTEAEWHWGRAHRQRIVLTGSATTEEGRQTRQTPRLPLQTMLQLRPEQRRCSHTLTKVRSLYSLYSIVPPRPVFLKTNLALTPCAPSLTDWKLWWSVTEIPTIIVTPCVGPQKLHEQGDRAAGRSRSESDDLSFRLFSTVGSEGTVTLFPTTAERALCEVH